MGKIIKDTIHANGIDIGIYTQDFENEFISLTDIARYKSDDPTAVIQNWMRNRDVIEFLGLWERLHNSDFKPLEFEGFKKQAGANAFTMSPKKWIEGTLVKSGQPDEGCLQSPGTAHCGTKGVPFCAEAWDAVARYIYTGLQGGSIMRGWMKEENTMIACCNDGTRPVIFKIERIDCGKRQIFLRIS